MIYENFNLCLQNTLNMLKTTRVYFGVLHIQGMFLLSRLQARVLFDFGASHSFIAASVVIKLGLEVETLEEPLYVSSPLGIRARIGMIC